jgi:hypothetical protein
MMVVRRARHLYDWSIVQRDDGSVWCIFARNGFTWRMR